MAGKYRIVCKPEDRGSVGDDVEKNISSMVVKLTNGSHTEEICRVGFARENSNNPDVPFKQQLNDALDRARVAADILNEQLAPSGELL